VKDEALGTVTTLGPTIAAAPASEMNPRRVILMPIPPEKMKEI
jgi:hypothetical protein